MEDKIKYFFEYKIQYLQSIFHMFDAEEFLPIPTLMLISNYLELIIKGFIWDYGDYGSYSEYGLNKHDIYETLKDYEHIFVNELKLTYYDLDVLKGCFDYFYSLINNNNPSIAFRYPFDPKNEFIYLKSISFQNKKIQQVFVKSLEIIKKMSNEKIIQLQFEENCLIEEISNLLKGVK